MRERRTVIGGWWGIGTTARTGDEGWCRALSQIEHSLVYRNVPGTCKDFFRDSLGAGAAKGGEKCASFGAICALNCVIWARIGAFGALNSRTRGDSAEWVAALRQFGTLCRGRKGIRGH